MMTFLVLFSLFLLIASCQPTPNSGEIKTEQLASIICACAKPMVSYNDNLRALAAADDMGQLTQEMAKGDEVLHTAELCITDQTQTSTDNLLNEKLKQQVMDQCQLDKRMVDDLLLKMKDLNRDTFQ